MSEDPIKDILNRLPYGFYGLTTHFEDEANAMVMNWFMQVSFEPRLVAIGLSKKAYTHELIEKSGIFAVNIFNREDEEALTAYSKARAKRPDKMEGADFTSGPATGAPVLADAAGYLECKVVQLVDIGGDHDLLVGEVVNAGVLKPGDTATTLTLPDVGWSYSG